MPRLLTHLSATLLLAGILSAQQASWTSAPTVPLAGHFILRTTATRALHEEGDGTPRRSQISRARIDYGLSGDHALFFELPLRGRGHRHDPTLGDVSVGWKWRFHATQPAPGEQGQASLSLGATLPTGADRHTAEETVPQAELAWMQTQGRLSIGASLSWQGKGEPYRRPLFAGESGEECLRYAGALVYRLDRAARPKGIGAATYLTLEAIGTREDNGDTELAIAPGLLYEAPNFAAELSFALPTNSDVTDRPESDGALLFGLRFLW